MIIDCMEWHYRDNYPDDIDKIHASTHIGIFIAWIIENNLESEYLRQSTQKDIERLKQREITGREFFLNNCNNLLQDKMIDKKVLKFILSYYLSSREDYCQYIADYNEVFKNDNLNSSYEVKDIWENYYRVFSIIDKRYNDWQLQNENN
jgi:hypothetical protein